jgi:hypothetical protein
MVRYHIKGNRLRFNILKKIICLAKRRVKFRLNYLPENEPNNEFFISLEK